jgi:hypothetical protein
LLGAVSQIFAASANLDMKIVSAASGCATPPQNASGAAQYRMQWRGSWKPGCRFATPRNAAFWGDISNPGN